MRVLVLCVLALIECSAYVLRMAKPNPNRYLRPGTFGAQCYAYRSANNVTRDEASAATGLHAGTIRAMEFGRLLPPCEPLTVLALARVIGGNDHSMMALALQERQSVEVPCNTPARLAAAVSLALAWHDMTDEQLAQVERLTFGMRRM